MHAARLKVYQDFALAGNVSIYENIYLGREPGRKLVGPLTIVNHKLTREMAREHLNKLKITVKSIDQPTENLSGGQRQAVAIARATAFDAKLVIMDEPTAALAIKEVGKVLDLIRSLNRGSIFCNQQDIDFARNEQNLRPNYWVQAREMPRRSNAFC